MEYKKLFDYPGGISEALKKVDLFKSLGNFEISNCGELLKNSAIGLMNEYILDFFEKESVLNKIDAFYLEYTSIASQVGSDKFFDFISVWQKDPSCKLKDNINTFYKSIYSLLGKLKKGIFYNEAFFYKNLDGNMLLSEDSDYSSQTKIFNEMADQIIPDPSKKIDLFSTKPTRGGELFFYNPTIEANIKFVSETGLTLDEHQQFLHFLFDRFFIGDRQKSSSILLSIPVLGASVNESSSYSGLGAVFLYLVVNTEKSFNEEILGLGYNLSYLQKDILLNFIYHSGIDQKNKAITRAYSSAVAAIMGRNMSHNIGSHVLSNLKDETNKIGEKLFENKDFENLSSINFFEFYKNNLGLHSRFFFGFTWFLNYLQERQDYIATISGFENQTFIPVNFKSFILDGFLPDHRYQRHKSGTNGNAEVKDHKNYLLEYITKSENIDRKDIKVFFRDFDTSQAVEECNSFEIIKMINISLPGGILGRQAIFSIFENFIRNSAKHSKLLPNSELKIIIDTPDINLVSNSSKHSFSLKTKNGLGYDANEYIKFTLTDNVKSYANAQDTLCKALRDPLINKETGILNPENKGIKEMRISAAWLRGISIYEIDEFDKHYPRILVAEKSREDSIQYVFYLLKPKELLIVLTQKSFAQVDKENDLLNNLLDFGIEIVTIEELKNRASFCHSLFVLEKGIDRNEIKLKFNQRIIDVDFDFIQTSLNELIKPIIDQKATKQFITKFWKKRLIEFRESRSTEPIFISDDCFKENESGFKVYHTSNSPKILFRKHNDTKNQFNEFKNNINDNFSNIEFVEGITGGNSTDLYLRKLPKDTLFYYKLLESCLTKVLIIDERIWGFKSNCKIEDLFLKTEEEIKSVLGNIQNINDENDWVNRISTELNVGLNSREILTSLYNSRDEISLVTQSLIRNGLLDAHKRRDIYNYELLNKKGIEILNISFSKEYNECNFYNLKTDEFKPVLTFYKNENGSACLKMMPELKADIITIHQSIIDKIHEKMNVDMGIIFNKLLESFPDPIIKIIHSGRGKPSSRIPIGFYFLPYASLENAFNDCKLSLTEVLFNVKAELQ